MALEQHIIPSFLNERRTKYAFEKVYILNVIKLIDGKNIYQIVLIIIKRNYFSLKTTKLHGSLFLRIDFQALSFQSMIRNEIITKRRGRKLS